MASITAGRARRGAATIEVALATVIFFMLVLAVIDLARLQFYRSRLQYAVSQATRFATTGGTMTDSKGKKMSREASIVQTIKNLSGVNDFQSGDIAIQALGKSGQTVSGPGGPGDVVTVSATYNVLILAPYLSSAFSNGRYRFTVATSYRNEEFAQASAGGNGGDNDDDSDSDG